MINYECLICMSEQKLLKKLPNINVLTNMNDLDKWKYDCSLN